MARRPQSEAPPLISVDLMSRPRPAIRPSSRANHPADRFYPNRVSSNNGRSTPILGTVFWSPIRSFWFCLMYGGAVLGGYATFQLDALALCLMTSAIALCIGYSVGIHRLLIHNSFQCHRWVEAFFVYIGTLAGLGGPFTLIEQHDIREWAQASPRCHDYFTGRQNLLTDWVWTMYCELQLHYPPVIRYETHLTQNRFYQWLEQTWMFQQLPLAIAFYYYGGWSWVFWGIHVRISLCATLLWLANYLTCRTGQRPLYARNAALQLGNIPMLGLLTMGESWQNNHQNDRNSARFGLRSQQDPGWWLLEALSSAGLVWNITQPKRWAPTPTSRSATEVATPMRAELPQLSSLTKYRKS